MAMSYDFLKTLYADVVSMLSRLVVKRWDLAHARETTETARAFELYRACVLGSRYFYNFATFDVDILQDYLDPATARLAAERTSLIPEIYREDIVRRQAQRVIDGYEERNDYYRMLMGLPSTDTRRYIYVTDHANIDPATPVHELSNEQISQLEMDGTIDRLKELNPDAGYLDYLGPNRIDFVTARLAKPFDILRLGPPTSNRTREMLETEYYKARKFVMVNLFNQKMFPPNSRELYHPFLGLLMITLAVRNTLVPSEADYLNFEEILDSILESYGLLSYFKRFPFTYKRPLVLALDKILANKGTDGVLIDICNIFNFDDFDANRYYLMKTYRKDPDGNVIIDPDNPYNTWELNFVKSDIQEHEIDFNAEDMLSYEEVTNADYLWQLTDEETRDMLKEEYNLMMSKYISVDACFDVTMLTFEVCCFINMVLWSRSNLQQITISNHYATAGTSNIWTMLVFLLAAMAKKANFDGNIVYEPEAIAEIMRFNYGDIQEELQTIIEKYTLQIDVADGTQVVPGFDTIALDRPLGYIDGMDAAKIYVRNRDLYEAILQEMASTQDYRQYQALVELRDTLFFSASEEVSFTKTDGTHASTYYEMLQDMDPRITERLDLIEDEDELNEMILYILEKLEDVFNSPELRYLFLNTSNNYNTIISRYLRTAINVFKASSVQLESINIVLYLGDHEPVRVIDYAYKEKHAYIHDVVHIDDEVALHKTIILEDHVMVGDRVYTEYQ